VLWDRAVSGMPLSQHSVRRAVCCGVFRRGTSDRSSRAWTRFRHDSPFSSHSRKRASGSTSGRATGQPSGCPSRIALRSPRPARSRDESRRKTRSYRPRSVGNLRQPSAQRFLTSNGGCTVRQDKTAQSSSIDIKPVQNSSVAELVLSGPQSSDRETGWLEGFAMPRPIVVVGPRRSFCQDRWRSCTAL